MGASESSLIVTQRKNMEILRKKQAAPEFFKLVDDRGKGDLVILAKTALKTGNYDILDAAIKEKVGKYLYNGGKGKSINIETLVSKRINEVNQVLSEAKNPSLAKSNAVDVFSDKPTPNTKTIYFDIDKRGRNGGTILHVCQLNNTKHHDLLTKRMITCFPQLINEICLSDEFYGQTVMHIAIAQENQLMIHFLLAHQVDVHIRACGSFFSPTDQMLKRVHDIGSELPIVPVQTDYKGLAYYGEYPLSTAAVLNDRASVRILLKNKANPDMQDMNGNTVVHMMVIYDNMEILGLLLDETKANLFIKNRQGYTPLTLATLLGRVEAATAIIEKMRNLNWSYADVSCAAYPHITVDTITEDGHIDTKSFLNLLVESTSEEHLDLYDGVFTETVTKKWDLYIKKRFYVELVFYFTYFLIMCVTVILKRGYFDYMRATGCTEQRVTIMQEVEVQTTIVKDTTFCQCQYLYANDSGVGFRTFMEILCLIYTVLYVLFFVREVVAVGFKNFLKLMAANPSRIFMLITLICVLLCLPMRLSCQIVAEDYFVTLAITFLPTYILYLGRGIKRITVFAYIIQRVIKTDLITFIAIYVLFLMGFSQAFYIIYDYGRYPNVDGIFISPMQSVLNLLSMAGGDLERPYVNLKLLNYSIIGRFYIIIYATFCQLLLVNLFIATLSDTYALTSECEKEWLRQWAAQILCIEYTMSVSERKKALAMYTDVVDGERVINITWKQSEDERDEFKKEKSTFKERLAEDCRNLKTSSAKKSQ